MRTRYTDSARPVAALALACAGCSEPAPELTPGFEPLFGAEAMPFMANSSPALRDLDGDGVEDIVFGTGIDRLRPVGEGWAFAEEPEFAGHVHAVSGATNAPVWRAEHTGEAFTTPRFVDVNRDGTPDVIMGGRQGALAAFDGRSGSRLWRADPGDVANTPVPYNFFTPAVVPDLDGDGVDELVVTYGGDDTRPPHEPRSAGRVVVIGGADGEVLAVHQTPDGAETYASPVVYERGDGTLWVVFGTGGETHGGGAFRAPVASLMDRTFPERVERLLAPGEKGVIAPATVVELGGDDEPELVFTGFDGRVAAVDGASGELLWSWREVDEETYHPAAVVQLDASGGRLGLFLSHGIGTFPNYAGSAHRLVDAVDGRVIYRYRSPVFPAGAPLALDLSGDGTDEILFFGGPGRIHLLHGRDHQVLFHDVPWNLTATPRVADPRGTGTLELIGVAWWDISASEGLVEWRNFRSRLMRLDLGAPPPERPGWAGYMGTAGDGQYRSGSARAP